MSNSVYSKINFHITLHTKTSLPMINERIEDRLYQILTILGLPYQQARATGRKDMKIVIQNSARANGESLPALKQAYYLSISGTSRVTITDENGNTNTPIGDIGFELGVPGVNFSGGIYEGEGSYQELSFPAEEGSYTIKFKTGTDSVDIEVLKGVGNVTPNLTVRYLDLELPPNVDCIMTFNPQGVPDLAYDSKTVTGHLIRLFRLMCGSLERPRRTSLLRR